MNIPYENDFYPFIETHNNIDFKNQNKTPLNELQVFINKPNKEHKTHTHTHTHNYQKLYV